MATETFTEQNDRIVALADSLAAGSSFTITADKIATDTGESAYFEAATFVVGNATDVNTLADGAGDLTGTPQTNVTLDTFSGAGISTGNSVPVIPNRVAVQVRNTASVAQDVVVVLDRAGSEGED